MADLDEDAPHLPTTTSPQQTDPETDLSDETQDFRFLSTLATKIPKRGEKDFEPHATNLQSDTLAASRAAMHSALAFPRFHAPATKAYTLATYHPETNCAYAVNPRGQLFARMGRVRGREEDPFGGEGGRGQRVWLLPEEALYLVERGTLDLRWPGREAVSMSLQGAYAMFVGEEKGGLSLERYSVYAGLKRIGYTVMRAPSWDCLGGELGEETFAPRKGRRGVWEMGLGAFWERLFGERKLHSEEQLRDGPLVAPGLYRSYANVYTRLALIDSYDPTTHHRSEEKALPGTDPNFRITYHVWKPGSTTFKKSAPGIPDFRIAVVNARETTMPTLEQLSSLLDTTPYDPPKEGAQLYNKLKYGYKNVILAIVDQGVTSYLRLSDAAFGREKLFNKPARGPGGKRGGRGGGRGRGGKR